MFELLLGSKGLCDIRLSIVIVSVSRPYIKKYLPKEKKKIIKIDAVLYS